MSQLVETDKKKELPIMDVDVFMEGGHRHAQCSRFFTGEVLKYMEQISFSKQSAPELTQIDSVTVAGIKAHLKDYWR